MRKRNLEKSRGKSDQITENDSPNDSKRTASHKETHMALDCGSYWLTRIVLLRALGFVYSVAFLVALHQNSALLGHDGLVPVDAYLNKVKESFPDATEFQIFQKLPTLLWFVDYQNGNIDMWMNYIAMAGLGLSAFVCIFGMANMPLMTLIWLLYHSLVNVGQAWYSFGWESQILETGFLAIFLCPLFTLRKVPRNSETSFIVILGYRWLIFRIMLGAGLIKIRGDKCWKDLTCMDYHYQTQPVPNPIAYFMHQEPQPFHKFEVLCNHFVELIAPFFIFLTRRLRITGGVIQILFQIVLIISGNLSFLNWLTIIPSLACFDDASLSWMFSKKIGKAVWQVGRIQQQEKKKPRTHFFISALKLRTLLNLSVGLLIGYLSVPIVQNLLSSRQIMNTSFDTFRLVNTYGAFGSITKERTEVIFQGTYGHPEDANTEWLEYEFKCKPGNVNRRPCLISPYHYRLDWLLWFAAFQNYQYNPWLVHLAAKFLVNDENATSLIEYNPFQNKEPPKYIRVEHYDYQYTKIGSKEAREGAWWTRKRKGSYLPPVDLTALKPVISQMGWKRPRRKAAARPKQ